MDDPSDTSDLIPVPPSPNDRATLIGGRVTDIDPVNDRLSVQPFGTKRKMKIFFDERSHVYRNGREVDPTMIHKGDRVYLDTQLDKNKSKVFARNVRVQTKLLQADAHGQIVNFNAQTGVVSVRDDLSGQDIRFHLRPTATVDNQGHPGRTSDLQPGSLVTAHFLSGQQGRNEVDQVTILAAAGSNYTFEGKLTHLDVRNHLLGLENQSDGKIYDIRYDPQRTPIGDLKVGSSINVSAKFNGREYAADSLSPGTGISLEEQEQAAKDEAKADDTDKSDKKAKKEKKHKKTESADDEGTTAPPQ